MEKILTAKIDGRNMEDDFEIIDAILDSRGIDDIGAFLKPTIEDMIPFEEMKGLHDAYTVIDDAITMGEKLRNTSQATKAPKITYTALLIA